MSGHACVQCRLLLPRARLLKDREFVFRAEIIHARPSGLPNSCPGILLFTSGAAAWKGGYRRNVLVFGLFYCACEQET